VAERSEAGWGIAQRVIDQSQNTLQIPIHFVVPETQYAEPLTGKMTVTNSIASSMGIEIVLAAIDFDNETVLQTDEIYDMPLARRLPAEVETLFSPRPQMNPQLHLLPCHSFAKIPRDFVGHEPYPAARYARVHPPPSGEGSTSPRLRSSAPGPGRVPRNAR
jgi:hypothetical protein